MRVKAVDRLKEKKKEKVTTPQCTVTLARELLEDISEDRRDTARKKEQGGGKREEQRERERERARERERESERERVCVGVIRAKPHHITGQAGRERRALLSRTSSL